MVWPWLPALMITVYYTPNNKQSPDRSNNKPSLTLYSLIVSVNIKLYNCNQWDCIEPTSGALLFSLLMSIDRPEVEIIRAFRELSATQQPLSWTLYITMHMCMKRENSTFYYYIITSYVNSWLYCWIQSVICSVFRHSTSLKKTYFRTFRIFQQSWVWAKLCRTWTMFHYVPRYRITIKRQF